MENDKIIEYNTVKNKSKNAFIIFFISLILTIGTLIILAILEPESPLYFLILIPFVIILIVSLIIGSVNDKKYSKLYKEIYVTKLIKEELPDATYSTEETRDSSIVEPSKIFYKGFLFTTSDKLIGKYKEVNYQVHDIKVKTRSDDDYVTVFQGQWYILDFNKKVTSELYLVRRKFHNISNYRKYNTLNTNNPIFDKEYKIYTTNELDALNILKPRLIENIMKLTNDTKGKIMFSFINDKLYIAISNNHDLFEPHSNKMINKTDEEINNEIRKEINKVKEIIDILELDKKMF